MNTIRLTYKVLFLILALGLGIILQAQSIRTKLSQAKVGLGKVFSVTYEFTGSDIGKYEMPDFKDFKVVGGPNHSSSTTIINNRFSSTKSLSFKLKAIKQGVILLPSISASIDGENKKSNTVSINVVKGFKTDKEKQQDKMNKQIRENLIVVPIISNRNPSIGEVITLKYKLIFNLNIAGYDLIEEPSFQGFYKKEISKEPASKAETYKGKNMQSAILKEYVLIPQKYGKIEIPNLEFQFTVKTQNRRSRDIWSSFFDEGKRTNITVPVQSIKLNVSDFPKADQPRSFEGAVGKISLASSLSKNTAKTNEAISLKLNLSGNGNIKFIDLPDLKFPDDIEVYDPKIADNIKENSAGMSGKKSYEYLLIPRYAGQYKLPSIPFSYYDPSKKEYIALNTPEYIINVDGEAKQENASGGKPIIAGKSVDLIGKDIRYIHLQHQGLNASNDLYFKSALFWVINLLAIILSLGLFFYFKHASKFKKDANQLRNKNASKLAKKYLSTAKESLDKPNKNEFYEAISKAIYKYTSDKLGINNVDLNKAALVEILSEQKVPEPLINSLISTLEACDLARYAPSSETQMNSLYQQVKQAILEFDKLA